tara:strand:- start:134 stop:700 length:567 start_codon:yes stop_codon:yes gene_type:complete
LKVGILAFQGDFALHKKILKKINIETILVKNSEDLNNSDALIIPGGESTVISKMIILNKLENPIKKFSLKKSIYGTCAGAILMSSKIKDPIIKPLNIINVEVSRNSWGRQIDSFSQSVKISISNKRFNANFIRAPKFKCLDNKLKILSYLDDEPILIENDKHLISSFHPELGNDTRIHEYFLKKVVNG